MISEFNYLQWEKNRVGWVVHVYICSYMCCCCLLNLQSIYMYINSGIWNEIYAKTYQY